MMKYFMPLRKPSSASVKFRGDLLHHTAIGLASDVGDVNLAFGQRHDEKHVKANQSAQGPGLDIEKIRYGHHIHVGANEGFPVGLLCAFGSGEDACRAKDVADCCIADDMSKVFQCSLDSAVTPVWVLFGKLDAEFTNDCHLLLALGLSMPLRRVFGGNEPAVPSHQRAWSYEVCILLKRRPAQLLSLLRQAVSLWIGQVQLFAGGVELLLENAVFLEQIINDLLLLSVHPARDGGQKNDGLRVQGKIFYNPPRCCQSACSFY